MTPHKRLVHSAILNRTAYADVFSVGTEPRFLVVLFGGSGVDEEEYERRGQTVHPALAGWLGGFADGPPHFVLIHVTAPYDVPFARFATEPTAAANWTSHVLTELLEPWVALPYLVCGFSGGVVLALNGVHADPRCFGGAAFGADAVPADFSCPKHWRGKLRLYCAPGDRVCCHPANRRVAESLVSRGEAELYELRAGGHALADYCAADGLGDAIAFANGFVTPDRPRG